MCLPPRVYRIAHLFRAGPSASRKKLRQFATAVRTTVGRVTIGCNAAEPRIPADAIGRANSPSRSLAKAAKSLQRFETIPRRRTSSADARRAWLTVNAPLEPLLDRFVEPPPLCTTTGNVPCRRHAPQSPQETIPHRHSACSNRPL